MVGLMDFFTGGDPEQMAQIDPRYGVPRADVRDAAVNALANLSATLLAAGQPIAPAQRAQLLAGLGGAASGVNADLYNASQRRLMTAQTEQRRSEIENERRIGQLMQDPEAFQRETGQPLSAFRGMNSRDVSQALRQIAIAQATPRPPVAVGPGYSLVDPRSGQPLYTSPPRPQQSVIQGPGNIPLVVDYGTNPPTFRIATEQGAGAPAAPAAPTPAPAAAALTEAAAAPAAPTAPPVDLRRPPAAPAPAAAAAPTPAAALRPPVSLADLQRLEREGRVSLTAPRQDYRYTPDFQAQEPIPGTPTARSEERQRQSEVRTGGVILREIDRALDLMDTAALPTAGFGATTAARIPGTAASDVRSLIDTVRANIGFQQLNQMRQESPTGGALGNVTVEELRFLQNAAGSLDQSQSPAQFRQNLNNIREMYLDVIHGPGNRPPGSARPERRPTRAQGTPETPRAGEGTTTQRPGEIRTPGGLVIRPIQ